MNFHEISRIRLTLSSGRWQKKVEGVEGEGKKSRVSKNVGGIRKCRGYPKMSRVSENVEGIQKDRGYPKKSRLSK